MPRAGCGVSKPRMKLAGGEGDAVYHCVSRVVDRRFIFQAAEKDQFVALLREFEEFCQVRVLTFCVMANHFHILVQVPRRPAWEDRPGPARVCEMLGGLSGHQNVGAIRQRFEMYREARDEAGLAAYLATFHARMWDVSAFIGLLKQRFTLWYNQRTGRKGTLWEERFRSVLVEGVGSVLATMAAYIDLNPVRAGIVQDPKDYRWSGYGEAVGGKVRAKQGLQMLVTGMQRGREESPSRSLEIYRLWVFQEGSEEREGVDASGRPRRGAIPREEVLRVLEANGELPPTEYVRCRVRYFSDGAILGGKEFVEQMFGRFRDRFGVNRKDGARRMTGLGGQGEGERMFAARALRVRVFG